jgi:hypothetical protein
MAKLEAVRFFIVIITVITRKTPDSRPIRQVATSVIIGSYIRFPDQVQ